MSYQVFALKWRPQNFEEVVGQPQAVTTLKNAILRKKIAHAYLFAGPRGVGKTSIARILAKCLNCLSTESPVVKPCGKCTNCQEVSQGRSIDVLEIDGASNRGIDEIRSLREAVKFVAASSRYKVYIIDEVHMLTTEAFNALLKTLEEPPAHVKFIFATTQPHKVIPTVLSRCHRLDFYHIAVKDIIVRLSEIVKEEGIDIDEASLLAIAKEAEGSLRDAESLLDQLASFSRDKIDQEALKAGLGLIEEGLVFRLADCILKSDVASSLEFLDELQKKGEDLGHFLSSFQEHIRNLIVTCIFKEPPANIIDLPADVRQRLKEQAGDFRLQELLPIFYQLVEAQEMAKKINSLRMALEITLVRIILARSPAGTRSGSKAPQTSSPHKHPHEGKGQPEHRKEAPERETKGNPVPLSEEKKEGGQPKINREEPKEIEASGDPAGRHLPAKEEPESPVSSLDLTEIMTNWKAIIRKVGESKISVAAYLQEGRPVKLEGNTLQIGLPSSSSLHREVLQSKENTQRLVAAIKEILGVGLKIAFITVEGEPAKTETDVDTAVRSALDTFGGRLINGF